jgi:hypothetical protein
MLIVCAILCTVLRIVVGCVCVSLFVIASKLVESGPKYTPVCMYLEPKIC